MAFTVGDCCNIDKLLLFVAGMPGGAGSLVAPAEALKAAVELAERAHASLGAGIDIGQMRKRWPKAPVPAHIVAAAPAIVRLMGELQDYLESLIECHLIPGTAAAAKGSDALIVADARRKWREAESIVKLLTAKPAKRKAVAK